MPADVDAEAWCDDVIGKIPTHYFNPVKFLKGEEVVNAKISSGP